MITLICTVCGQSYTKAPHESQSKYCSLSCSARGQSQKITLQCAHCGNTFQRAPSQIKSTSYCSLACFKAARPEKPILLCLHCGRQYNRPLRMAERGTKYCSIECQTIANQKVLRNCDVCGKPFKVYPYELEGRKYCSNKCVGIANRVNPDMIGGSTASRRRASVIRAYGGVCVVCNEGRLSRLALNHIHGGGGKHIRDVGGVKVYEQAEKDGYPPDYNVLCHNCNWRDHMSRMGRSEKIEARRTLQYRLAALACYGSRCVLCGEQDAVVLSFDHIHGNGGKQRAAGIRNRALYILLLKTPLDPAYRILCRNCNESIGRREWEDCY